MLPGWNMWLKSSFGWSRRGKRSLTSYTGKHQDSASSNSAGKDSCFSSNTKRCIVSISEKKLSVCGRNEKHSGRRRRRPENDSCKRWIVLISRWNSIRMFKKRHDYLIVGVLSLLCCERYSWGGSSSWSLRCKITERLRRSHWGGENNWSRSWSRRGRPEGMRRSKKRGVGRHGCKRSMLRLAPIILVCFW